jgi:hypothetical protein
MKVRDPFEELRELVNDLSPIGLSADQKSIVARAFAERAQLLAQVTDLQSSGTAQLLLARQCAYSHAAQVCQSYAERCPSLARKVTCRVLAHRLRELADR